MSSTSTDNAAVRSAYDALEAARNRLYVAVAERKNAKALGQLVNDVAEAEGRHEVIARLFACVEQGESPADALAAITRDAMQIGADDTWSGRGGDVARARFDGIRKTINDARWMS